jgi:hypothetical protein
LKTKLPALVAAAVLSGAFASSAALARDQIKIVGSSTVFPYTQAVAEEFTKARSSRRPLSNPPALAAALRYSVKVLAKTRPILPAHPAR